MSVQALISSCASEVLPCEMEGEDVGRDAPGWVIEGLPCSLKGPAGSCSVLQGCMSNCDLFVALPAPAQGVPVVCGAQDVFLILLWLCVSKAFV